MEHVRHIFVESQFARRCWELTGPEFDLSEVEIMATWVLNKFEEMHSENLVHLVTVLWGIYYARNMKVWDDKVVTPMVAMDISSKMIQEWRNAQQKQSVAP